MIYKKSVVLSAIDNSLKKAVLNIDSRAGNIKGTVKLYNFGEEPMGVLSLGLLIDGKVHKAGLTRVGYMEYTFGSILTKIPTTCTCAVVSSKGGKLEPILLGSLTQTQSSLESSLLKSLSILNEQSMEKVQEKLTESLGEYEEQDEIDEQIDECLSCEGKCANCDYKKSFYDKPQISRSSPQEKTQPEEILKDITKGELRIPSQKENSCFIDEIGGQIELLFNEYPEEEALAEIIPNSKWVKVEFNNDKKFYVVGLIYENNEIKYVCYGVPSSYSEVPPADFNEKAQWLPLDLSAPQGDGYWLTYQDATSGDLIQVEVV